MEENIGSFRGAVVPFSFSAYEEAVLPSAQEIVDGVLESFDRIRTY